MYSSCVIISGGPFSLGPKINREPEGAFDMRAHEPPQEQLQDQKHLEIR